MEKATSTPAIKTKVIDYLQRTVSEEVVSKLAPHHGYSSINGLSSSTGILEKKSSAYYSKEEEDEEEGKVTYPRSKSDTVVRFSEAPTILKGKSIEYYQEDGDGDNGDVDEGDGEDEAEDEEAGKNEDNDNAIIGVYDDDADAFVDEDTMNTVKMTDPRRSLTNEERPPHLSYSPRSSYVDNLQKYMFPTASFRGADYTTKTHVFRF